MINICGCVCILGAKQGMLELIPQTLFFLERARQYGGRVWVPGTRKEVHKLQPCRVMRPESVETWLLIRAHEPEAGASSSDASAR